MNAPAYFRALTLLLTLALVSCNKPVAEKDVIFGAIHEHVHAFEKKDVATVMATIHPDSPAYAGTKEVVELMFQSVDLKYDLSDLRIDNATPEEVKVSFKQKTVKVGGTGQFQNNIVEGIHTLRQEKGVWKIYKTIQVKITDLQGKPLFVSPEPPPSSPIEPAGKLLPADPAPPAAPAVPPATETAPPPTTPPAP